jgi:hypothetical protein
VDGFEGSGMNISRWEIIGLREFYAQAYQGTWVATAPVLHAAPSVAVYNGEQYAKDVTQWVCHGHDESEQAKATALLIVAMHNALPRLLDELERLYAAQGIQLM